jgi:hypothetical protein
VDPGIDFSNGEFPTVQAFPHITQRVVMPLVTYNKELIRPIGTCFAIAQGLVLTALHVIEDAVDMRSDTPDEWRVEALYSASPEPQDDVPAGKLLGGLLPAIRIFAQPALDIAAVQLLLPTNRNTNKASIATEASSEPRSSSTRKLLLRVGLQRNECAAPR